MGRGRTIWDPRSGRSSELVGFVSIVEPFLTVPRLRVFDWKPSVIKETARDMRDGESFYVIHNETG